MFNLRAKTDERLDREFRRAMIKLNSYEPHSKEYGEMLERVQKIQKLRTETKSATVSPDTALTTIAYLIGMLMIVHHEHIGIITTKAISHLPKPR